MVAYKQLKMRQYRMAQLPSGKKTYTYSCTTTKQTSATRLSNDLNQAEVWQLIFVYIINISDNTWHTTHCAPAAMNHSSTAAACAPANNQDQERLRRLYTRARVECVQSVTTINIC